MFSVRALRDLSGCETSESSLMVLLATQYQEINYLKTTELRTTNEHFKSPIPRKYPANFNHRASSALHTAAGCYMDVLLESN